MVNQFDPSQDALAASPCANVCQLVGQTCGTCYRHISEIAAWGSASREERRAINARVKQRRAQARQQTA